MADEAIGGRTEMKAQSSQIYAQVNTFWRRAVADGSWKAKNPIFDQDFRARFLELHLNAAARGGDAWIETAEGALALMVLLDQFPRNAFRGTGHMYATDGLARMYAREAERLGHMMRVEPELRVFFVFPFTHSEDLADQELSITLSARLSEERLEKAKGHRDIVRRFGRFPHRNPLLGRQPTAAEEAFLAAGGFQG